LWRNCRQAQCVHPAMRGDILASPPATPPVQSCVPQGTLIESVLTCTYHECSGCIAP
jgi:hypothetical protein